MTRKQADYRYICAFVIMLAFMVQAMIPAGFMPGADKNGKVGLVICTTEGEKTIWLDADQVPFEPGQENHKTQQHDCAFAPALAYDVPQPEMLLSKPFLIATGYRTSVYDGLQTHQFLKPWQAQAPPVLS